MKKHTKIIYPLLLLTTTGFYSCKTDKKIEKIEAVKNVEEDPNRIVNGIHVRTGLKDAEGVLLVANICTACHSADIVINNRMNEERWNTL